uniref:Putative tick metalloprotease n=1 Tax=Ixodes ricinus TaxID=34613 RepID=V5GEZ9_IXORI
MIIQWLLLLLTPGNHANELRGQIAYPRLLESRSEKSSQVVQIDPYLTLSLERSPIFRDYIKVFDLENGAYVTKTIPSQTYSEHLRQDKTHFSSLMFYETLHGPLLTGIVNITHAIEPDIVSSRDLNGAIPHRVQRISDDVTPTLFQRKIYKDVSRVSSRNGKVDKNVMSGQKGKYANQGKAKKSQKVYILEFTIVTDKWAMRNIDKRARVRYEAYYATVVNAVVLRFNLLRSPVIQLKLLGVYVVPTFVTSQIVERRGFYVLETGRELANHEKVTKALYKSDILIYATGWPKLDISRPHRLVIPTEYGFEGKVCTNMKFGYVVDEGYYQLIKPSDSSHSTSTWKCLRRCFRSAALLACRSISHVTPGACTALRFLKMHQACDKKIYANEHHE